MQQTIDGCPSIRQATFVIIRDPAPPIATSPQTFCADPDNGLTYTVNDIAVSANPESESATFTWYGSETATIPLSPYNFTRWKNILCNPNSKPCESVERTAVTINLDTQPSAGTNTVTELCDDLTGNINLFDLLEGNPSTGGTWGGDLPTSNGDQGTIDADLFSVTPGTYNFTYNQGVLNECVPTESSLIVNIVAPPEAGLDATTALCTSDAPVDLFTLLGPDAEVGGVWNPALPDGILNPQLFSAGTYNFQYTVAATAPCTTDAIATVEVNIQETFDPGFGATLTFCDETTAVIDLFDALGGTPDTGGTWSGGGAPTSNGDRVLWILHC